MPSENQVVTLLKYLSGVNNCTKCDICVKIAKVSRKCLIQHFKNMKGLNDINGWQHFFCHV